MTRILIVLPYSGAQFTGGLAVVNEQLTKALAATHDVRLLTCELHEKVMPKQEGHGNATILVIPSEETKKMGNSKEEVGDEERKRLYDLINSKEVILGGAVAKLLGDWQPDFILGHSRFSGPAAILLREHKFNEAKVGYFLHSYPPVEGVLLSGYDAFEEPVDVKSSKKKLEKEIDWINQADVVLAMGPLMRWGATLMLAKHKGLKKSRVHEVISGVTPGTVSESSEPSKFNQKKEVTLLLSGRASAPVKGFQDIVVAALQLRNAQRDQNTERRLNYRVHIKVRGMNEVEFPSYTDHHGTKKPARSVNSKTVNEWTQGVFGNGGKGEDMVTIEVLDTVSQKQVLDEYRSADGVLTAAYLEHFGLVPFEALGCGRPVLVSELSGSGQFLMSRYSELGKACVVEDFAKYYPRPLTNAVLKSVSSDAFDQRPDAWENAIFDLVNNIETRIANARELKQQLENEYTVANFAQSVVAAFDSQWDEKITRQIAGGNIEAVPTEEH